jgi:hypothetical protein
VESGKLGEVVCTIDQAKMSNRVRRSQAGGQKDEVGQQMLAMVHLSAHFWFELGYRCRLLDVIG